VQKSFVEVGVVLKRGGSIEHPDVCGLGRESDDIGVRDEEVFGSVVEVESHGRVGHV
jgi:hypothetical protein